MPKKQTLYSKIFETYELTHADIPSKEKIRKYIKRKLKTSFPNKNWDDLSILEQERFVYIEIREKFINDYVDFHKQNRITNKINRLTADAMLKADMKIREENDEISKVFKTHYKETDSDSDKQDAYNQFCKDMKIFNKHMTIPSYDKWIKDPLTIYEYWMYHAITPMEIEAYEDDNRLDVPQSEIDSVILKIILPPILKELRLTINIPMIKEALTFIRDFELELEPLTEYLVEYDPSLSLSKARQLDIIEQNKKYFTYKDMLADLTKPYEEMIKNSTL